MQNKLDMLFQLSRAIGGPNHAIMKYSLLSQCDHNIGLNSLTTYYLTWHTRPNSRSEIILWGYDSIH